MFSRSFRAFVLAAVAAAAAFAPSESLAKGKAGTMEIVGKSGVSAQMMFLGTDSKVYILDKSENNKAQVNGHPAWGVEYDINSNTYRAMDVRSNTFCAGGATLGDGRYFVTGGNKAVKQGGATAQQGAAPYKDYNGGKAIRFLTPCDDESCNWVDKASNQLVVERWYPTVEPLKDGHVIVIGGMRDGGFVPSHNSNEASYEFYPPKNNGLQRYLPLIDRTVPLNLYPITFLMSSGELFIQSGRQAILWNYQKQSENRLPNIPHAPRVYPASAGTVLLPLRPKNNYLETVLFCGGMSLGKAANWGNEGGPSVMVTERPASNKCDQISPLAGATWTTVDDLPQARSMGQFIIMPDGKLWFGNGVQTGVAGYSTDPNNAGQPVGQSFGDNPSYQPYVYNPEATLGNRWKAVAKANVGRLYHSSATLLPDGSILVSGSNPNADVNNDVKWKTNYDVERFYPEYYDSARPSSKGLPTTLSYGGNKFTITLDSAAQAAKAKVVVIRTGFSTHAMNMGQRMLELRSVAVGNTLHVAQMEPNPNLFAPGPALAFVVVDGVPSHGKFVMVGNGQIGTQPVAAASSLPNAAGKRAEGAEEDGEEIGEQLEEEAMPKEEVPEQHRRGSNAYDRVQRQRL